MKRSRPRNQLLRARSLVQAAVAFVTIAIMAANSAWAQLERTGLPVPRFVSLKASEANLRAGPGTRYPVQWVYRRIGLPLEITAEFYNWRQVRDPDGTEGWMHGSMLSGTRTLIISQPVAVLFEGPSDESNPVARLESGVIAEIDECVAESDWCRVQVGTTTGWISASNSWGVTDQD